jgi:hypothetical protein
MGHANPSFLVQMAGPNPTRNVSEKTARHLESALGLPAGWLDLPQAAAQPVSVDATTISSSVQRVLAMCNVMGLTLSATKQGDLIGLLYETETLGGKIDDSLLRQLVLLAK